MRLEAPFVFPVAVFDFGEFLEHARAGFTDAALNTLPDTGGHSTNLVDYGSAFWMPNTKNLGTGPVADALHDKLLASAGEFLLATHRSLSNHTPVLKDYWLNEMVAGASHPDHSHYVGALSGCFYIDIPDNSGGITFTSPRCRYDAQMIPIAQYTPYNSRTWKFDPQPGEVYIWESWLTHGVYPTTFDGVRRSAAFDIVLKENT
jgi:hypothetical protein